LIDVIFRVDVIASSIYAYRKSDNGEIDPAVSLNQTEITVNASTTATERFVVAYSININLENKPFTIFSVDAGVATSAFAPNRRETNGKLIFSSQYTSAQMLNTQAGDYDIDSNLSALGTD